MESHNEAKHAYDEAFRLELEQKDHLTDHLKDLLYASKDEATKLRTAYEELREQMQDCLSESQQKEMAYIRELDKERELRITTEAEKTLIEIKLMKLESDNIKLNNQLTKILRNDDFRDQLQYENYVDKFRESEIERQKLQQALISAHEFWNDYQIAPNDSLEKENRLLQEKITNLSGSLRVSEQEVLVLREISNKTSSNEQHYQNQVYSLNKKVSVLQQENESLQQTTQELIDENNQYRDALDKFKSTIVKQEAENSELSEQLKSAIESFSQPRARSDNVDTELKCYLLKAGIRNPFVKVSEGLYSLGNKRFSISLRNGAPVIRVGGGYMFIEEFLKIYLTQNKRKPDDEDTPKRSQSLEPKLGKCKTVENLYKDELENSLSLSQINSMTPVQTPRKTDSTSKDLKKQIASVYKAKLQQVSKQINPLREYTPLSSRRLKCQNK